jgi:hypothetical protein
MTAAKRPRLGFPGRNLLAFDTAALIGAVPVACESDRGEAIVGEDGGDLLKVEPLLLPRVQGFVRDLSESCRHVLVVGLTIKAQLPRCWKAVESFACVPL